jgi:transcriptional regulator with PAS, ATPase and Fis domain
MASAAMAALAGKMVCDSPIWREILSQAESLARSCAPVMIYGPTGSGKCALTEYIHMAGRSGRPLIRFPCATIPPDLVDATLFGSVRGAYTGATGNHDGYLTIADQGTLVLDDIDNLPLIVQGKLLGALESGEFMRLGSAKVQRTSVRFLGTTNRVLPEMIKTGTFRDDLYYRFLAVITIPGLDERPEDLSSLIRRLLRDVDINTNGCKLIEEDKIANYALRQYSWPGGVRELLRYIIHALLKNGDAATISTTRIAAELPAMSLRGEEHPPQEEPGEFQNTLRQTEADLIKEALGKADGNQTRAAVMLNITRDSLRYKMKKLHLR